jgi:two-component system, NarL family, response regulator DesR
VLAATDRVPDQTGLGAPGNLRRALAAGVLGFLLKGGPTEELIDAVRIVAHGGRAIDPRLGLPTRQPRR